MRLMCMSTTYPLRQFCLDNQDVLSVRSKIVCILQLLVTGPTRDSRRTGLHLQIMTLTGGLCG